MPRFIPLFAVCLLAWPLAASAAEFRSGVAVDTIWSDNALYAEEDRIEDNDFSFRFRPYLEGVDEEGALHWGLRYEPGYEYYIDQNDLRGWDHLLDGNLSWRASDRLELGFEGRAERYRSIQRFNELVEDGSDTTLIIGQRERFSRFDAEVYADYELTSRQNLRASYSYLAWDYSDETRNDIEINNVSLAWSYAFDQRTRTGLAASWRQRENENDAFGFEDSTDFYTLAVTLSHVFDATSNIQINVGPTWIEGEDLETATSRVSRFLPFLSGVDTNGNPALFFVDYDSCDTFIPEGALFTPQTCDPIPVPLTNPAFIPNPQFIVPILGTPDDDNSTTTVFANISFQKRFSDQVNFFATFRRQEDQSSAQGSSGVSNVANVRLAYKPSPRWHFAAQATYTLREQELNRVVGFVPVLSRSPIPICTAPNFGGPCNPPAVAVTGVGGITAYQAIEAGSNDEITTIRFTFNTNYQWDARTRLRMNLAYQQDEREIGSFAVRDFNRFTVWFGVTYAFDPVRF